MEDEKRSIKQPIKVWHVEDNREWQKTIGDILTKAKYQVLTTGSATKAKELIPDRVRELSVAILDNNLKDGTGEQIAKLLRKEEIPIGIIGLATGKTSWADISFDKLDGSGDEQIAKWLTAVAELAAGK